MVKTMAPTMYHVFDIDHYLVTSKVEEILGIHKPKPIVGIDEHVSYALAFFSSNLVPERKNGKMVAVV